MKHLALATLAFCAAHTSALADTYDLKPRSGLDAYLNGEYLLGDPGGRRHALKESGVEIFGYWTGIYSGNVSGGLGRGSAYVDDFWLGVNLNLEQLFGWKGGHLTVSGINRDGGTELRTKYVGSVYSPQQTFGGQRPFLYQVFLDQHFFDEKLSIKLGRFSASDDFNGSPLYGMYVNNGINGNIRNVLFDTQFSAYPFATWAARVNFSPNTETNFKIGVFQTTDHVFENDDHGLDWGIRGNDGVFLIAQAEYGPQLFKRAVPVESDPKDAKGSARTELKGLPGHYWIGGSFSPWKGFTEFRTGQQKSGSYGFYAHADQMVYQESPGSHQGLILWTAAGYYPQEEISIVPFQVNTGVIYEGLIPGRDRDRTILGLIYGRFSRDYAADLRLAGNGDPRYEMVLEGAYRLQLSKFAYLQPDVQYIIRPSGTGSIPNAVVIGAQMGVTF